MSRPVILLAGGGTGGHVFPMVAVADALSALSPGTDLVFVGTERGIETRVVPERGYRLELVDAVPMRGAGLAGAVRGAWVAAASIGACRRLLGRYRPKAVFSVGGYAAGPVSAAARTLRIPVALLEPNSEIGLANRLIAPFVKRAYTAFAEVERHFPSGAVRRTGVPIRSGFEPRPYHRSSSEPYRLLVLGGSQGAQALNEAVPQALAHARAHVSVVHQAGKDRVEPVRARYEKRLLAERARVVPFIDDVAAALAEAHLVIGRSGASAVAEICAVGRPSLLVPYPFAGSHQLRNAESLASREAAVCLRASEATPERLAEEIDRLAEDAALSARMADRARSHGRPHAARAIARDLLELAGLFDSAGEAEPAAGSSEDVGNQSLSIQEAS